MADATRRADRRHREEVCRLGQDLRGLAAAGDPLGEEAQAGGRDARARGVGRQPRQEDRGQGREGAEDERPPPLGAREARERHPGIWINGRAVLDFHLWIIASRVGMFSPIICKTAKH